MTDASSGSDSDSSIRPEAAADAPAAATDARIAVAQTTPAFGEIERNREHTVELVREHADADLLVLPELATSGYVFESESELATMAEPRDGATADAWADVAAETDTWIVGGFPEAADVDTDTTDANSRYYNSALVVSPNGVEAVYRKLHLWNEEHRWFTAGDELPVVGTPFGRLGVQICNDLWFPELTVTQAKAGVDLVAVPTNWVPGPADGTRPGGWTIGAHQALAHANANRVFVACADRAGTERGVTFEGQSVILDPNGLPLAGPAPVDGEHALTTACDLTRARNKELTPYDDALASRRPEHYDC
ncbi:putative carbon-nitrogen hydrolase [Natrialba magadii ATCC 43099]|uniref:Carbon-nitrogen hydrolase n=1 Tax=Natrialba magadii (strain ATCC 43099 / DSM 3394 / CCM 3739 / CIP 104546 / IAM 13178 / JCM 8861 / NBRC 102185 / NCIMB 2190 / MS3) TaxID=547559 RepID=D3SUV2_NATMM|nr:nitrilase family protein [Natrialba magadii]ADD05360.1 putative carbon-nitrogen hydrolase [Natrialba magadii ATCC 43099]ELY29322.1 nitrilase/cyanide hydratase and apolipoprotein N-acyltransferase [Natrialba magadii ATCC 43099]